MPQITPILDRRTLFLGAAGLVMTSALSGNSTASAAAQNAVARPTIPSGTGSAARGDFDFLTGEWTIKLRNFDGSGQERDASATVHRVLGGMGSIEELRKGDGSMWGMGVRVLHPNEGVWADHWTSAEDGVVNTPQLGTFVDGVGVFLGDDPNDGAPLTFRAVWDQITPTSCRWYQIMSRDGGATWDYGWYMDWTRLA
ncbi:MAG: hypothetical protein ABL882_08555 [Sphingopyxis sp.]